MAAPLRRINGLAPLRPFCQMPNRGNRMGSMCSPGVGFAVGLSGEAVAGEWGLPPIPNATRRALAEILFLRRQGRLRGRTPSDI